MMNKGGENRIGEMRGPFLWMICILSIIVVGIFVSHGIIFSNNVKAIRDASNIRMNELLTKYENINDSICVDINVDILRYMEIHENDIKQLLESQYAKIQAEYNGLSLWAGILMIVFLVFSIYSVLKTDEIIRQSREGLETVNECVGKVTTEVGVIEKQLNDAITTIDKKAEEEIRQLNEEFSESKDALNNKFNDKLEALNATIANKRNEFDAIVRGKTDELEKIIKEESNKYQDNYGKYVELIKSASRSNKKIYEDLIVFIRDHYAESDSEELNNG